MSRPAKAGDPIDRELATRFAQLRVAERAQAPDFPAEELLSPAARSPWYFAPRFAAASAAGIVALALFLASSGPAQDAGELYASIMASNEIATDQLMLASPGLLPEIAGNPAVYEIDMRALQKQSGE